MPPPNPPQPGQPGHLIDRILAETRSIAIVGLSTDPTTASARVGAYLQQAGYRVVPVHPTATAWSGDRVYRSLGAIDPPVDLAAVYRPAEECREWARQAVAAGVRTLWLPSGSVNEEAAAQARAAGLVVVMDRCLMVEHLQRGRRYASG